MSAADLAQFSKLILVVAKKYFNLPGPCRQRMLPDIGLGSDISQARQRDMHNTNLPNRS